VSVKPNQLNTPIDKKITQPETITVTDPRHPLFDQSFPLLQIRNKQDLVLSCHVQIVPGVNRLVPISLTDLATKPIDVFPSPLHISSLQNLTQSYQRIVAQVATERNHGANHQRQGSCTTTDGVANAQHEATATSVANNRIHLPTDGEPVSGGE
jgi:hypothetical protein